MRPNNKPQLELHMLLLAVEYGYKAAENGKNLQVALHEFMVLLNINHPRPKHETE